MDRLRYFFQQSWLLIVASFCFGLLIAVANAAWQDNILQNEEDKFNDLVREMIPDANTSEIELESVEVELEEGKKKLKLKLPSVRKALSAAGECVGWAFMCEGSGFADKIKLVLTVDADCEKLKGYGVLSSNETPGFGDKIKDSFYRNQFVDAPTTQLTLMKLGNQDAKDAEIVAISGATVSSEAVVTIVNKFLGQIKKRIKTHIQNEGIDGDGR